MPVLLMPVLHAGADNMGDETAPTKKGKKSAAAPAPKAAPSSSKQAAATPSAPGSATADGAAAADGAADGATAELSKDEARKLRQARLKAKRKARIERKKRTRQAAELGEQIGSLALEEGAGEGASGSGSGDDAHMADQGRSAGRTQHEDGAKAAKKAKVEVAAAGAVAAGAAPAAGPTKLSKKERVKIARTRKRELRKQQRQQQAAGGDVAPVAAAAPGAADGPVDVSAWRPLLLHPEVEQALSKLVGAAGRARGCLLH